MCFSKEDLYLKLECATEESKLIGRLSSKSMACLEELHEHMRGGHEGASCPDETCGTDKEQRLLLYPLVGPPPVGFVS